MINWKVKHTVIDGHRLYFDAQPCNSLETGSNGYFLQLSQLVSTHSGLTSSWNNGLPNTHII